MQDRVARVVGMHRGAQRITRPQEIEQLAERLVPEIGRRVVAELGHKDVRRVGIGAFKEREVLISTAGLEERVTRGSEIEHRGEHRGLARELRTGRS